MNLSIKQRVDISPTPKKGLANLMGLKYTTFSSKLNGFSRFTPEELGRLERLLSDIENAQAMESENNAPYFVK
jgi:hypothetical protein